MDADALQRLVHEAPCGLLSFADDGRVTFVNETLLALLGRPRADVEGHSVEALLTVSTRIFFQTHFFPLVRLHGRAEEIFLTLRTAAGQPLAVFANAVRRDEGDGGATHAVLFPLRERARYEEELLRAKQEAEAALAANESLTRDLARTLDELREAQGRLVQEEKLASLGRMARAVAHEIKNPLHFVVNFGMLAGDLADELRTASPDAAPRLLDDLRSNAERIVEHGRRADAVVQAMLAHVRDPAPPAESGTDANAAVRAAVARLRRQRPRADGLVAVDLDPTVGPVAAPADELRRVIESLLANAVDAVGTQPEDRTADAPRAAVRVRTRPAPSGGAEIVVSDDGPGIAEADLPRVFEPFFTTHPPGTGHVGLGLSMAHNRVARVGGTIEAASPAGGGATFTVTLPAAAPGG